MGYLTETNRNRNFADWRREFDRWFGDAATPAFYKSPEEGQSFLPACDLEEDDGHYLLSLEVPGVAKEDVKIEVEGNTLVVSGHRSASAQKKEGGTWYSERQYGSFQRAFTLPAHVDPTKIEAQAKDGILKIALPKAEAAKPRTVKVQDSTESSPGLFARFVGKPDGKGEKQSA